MKDGRQGANCTLVKGGRQDANCTLVKDGRQDANCTLVKDGRQDANCTLVKDASSCQTPVLFLYFLMLIFFCLIDIIINVTKLVCVFRK